jgi:WD40 repeat protein
MIGLLHASFDSTLTSSLAFATREGFGLVNLDHLEQNPFGTSESGVGCIQIFTANNVTMVAIVGSGDLAGSSPRKLKILDVATRETVHEISFHSSILSCAISSQYIAICLESKIHIIDVNGMKTVTKISTPINSSGIMTVSKFSNPTILAYSSSPTSGEFIVVNVDNLLLPPISTNSPCTAHKGRLASLKLNSKGTFIATASVTGTIIRVFDAHSSLKLFEFRRGLQHANITSLLFCTSDSLLLAGSSSGTVHIFQLGTTKDCSEPGILPETSSGIKPRNIFGNILRAAVSSVQQELRQSNTLSRALCIARIPRSEGPICMNLTTPLDGEKRLFIVTPSGYLYR